MSRPALRVGLLLNGWWVPRWIGRIVKEIRASESSRVTLVVVNQGVYTSAAGASPLGLWSRVRRSVDARTRQRLYSWLVARDARKYPIRAEEDEFHEESLEETLAGVPVLQVEPERRRYSDYFPPGAIAALQAADLDVALRFGFRILRGDVLGVPRYGVWSYHHGDNLHYRGGPPGFWEVIEENPITGCILQKLSSELDGGQVIARLCGPTDSRSIRLNKNRLYRASAQLVPRALTTIHQEGAAALEREPLGPGFRPYSRPLYRIPERLSLAPALIRMARRSMGARADALLFDSRPQWALALKWSAPENRPADAFFDSALLHPPEGRFWADPFVVSRDGKHHVFFEDYDHRTDRGRISVVEVSRDQERREPLVALEEPFHLSYPCVFMWKGEYYMVPESAAERRVTLYHSRSFPLDWRPVATLVEGFKAVDATLFEHGGRWWLFYSEGAPTNTELHLLHADTPYGPFRRHRRSPVKLDVRGARPAGHLFWKRGNLYRPGQDCSRQYGGAIVFHRVDRLDEEEYQELAVGRLDPLFKPGFSGTHTFNSAGELTVVDVHKVDRRLNPFGLRGRRG